VAEEMVINPGRCIGCATCALTCAVVNSGAFDLAAAFIFIRRHDFEGTFEIAFSSGCRGCKSCARVCPSGALRLVRLPDPSETTPV